MMDQARSAFSNLLGGETLSYTRFSLARQVDSDNSHVEMKLAVDDEENADNNTKANGTKPKRCNGSICCGSIAMIIFFLIGFMIGYLGYCKGVEPKTECERLAGTESPVREEPEEDFSAAPRLYWDYLKKKLSEKLDTTDFTSSIKVLNENSYICWEAGSQKDENLVLYIENQFHEFKLSKKRSLEKKE
uniref:Transferrin receptor protein 1 n=1 Tax=Macaca fascicularis TaxID=9541 RepID=A0A7N9D4Q1_MACFA